MPRVLIIDCFDSFTFNISHYLDEITSGNCEVIRYDALNPINLDRYSHIVFSPGPGLPAEYPKLHKVLSAIDVNTSILGICLGLQSIVEYFGGELIQLDRVLHGRQTNLKIDENAILFTSLPSSINVGHYHSWIASENNFPQDQFHVTSRSDKGYIMSIEHRSLPIYGLQFHPESILTEHGKQMLENFIDLTRSS